MERIEFKVEGDPAAAAEAVWKEFEKLKEEERAKKGTVGLKPSERRLLSSFVFVSKDGKEERIKDIE